MKLPGKNVNESHNEAKVFSVFVSVKGLVMKTSVLYVEQVPDVFPAVHHTT